MNERYYLAYGSNLSVAQMVQRCPYAVYVGKATIPDYQLLFKGSKTGSYLTIEKKKGSRVPVLVWKLTQYDEARLDCYEGYPTFYYKETMNVEVFSLVGDVSLGCLEAIVYIMDEQRKRGLPSLHYYNICLEGYAQFGFDQTILEKALSDSVGSQYARRLLKEVGLNA